MRSSISKQLGPIQRFSLGSALLALSITLTVPHAGAAANSCVSYFKIDSLSRKLVPDADLQAQMDQNYDSWNIKALREINKLSSQVRSLSTSVEGKRLLRGLNEILQDEHLASFHQLIQRAAENAQKDKRIQNPYLDGSNLLLSYLKNEVSRLLGKDIAAARIAELTGIGEITKEEMMRALGGISIDESRINLIGDKGIQDISPTSVIGRYLSEAKKMGHPVQTLVGKFLTTPTSKTYGSERIFISVDATTAPLIKELIGTNPHFLVHNHTPGQGTLHLNHNGQDISYAKYTGAGEIGGGGSDVGTLAPIIALSSIEASNAMNYFELGRLTRSARSKYPSSLVDASSGTLQPYMRPGAYNCCSHWFGEMGIGEKLVDTYSVPGQADQHGSVADPLAANQRDIRTGPVGSITHFSQYGSLTEIGNQTREDRLTRLVWQPGLGSEQMWSMLNAKKQLGRAELTNPGWILYALISTGDANRVPVVLVYRDNASEPLTQEILDRMRNRGNIPEY